MMFSIIALLLAVAPPSPPPPGTQREASQSFLSTYSKPLRRRYLASCFNSKSPHKGRDYCTLFRRRVASQLANINRPCLDASDNLFHTTSCTTYRRGVYVFFHISPIDDSGDESKEQVPRGSVPHRGGNNEGATPSPEVIALTPSKKRPYKRFGIQIGARGPIAGDGYSAGSISILYHYSQFLGFEFNLGISPGNKIYREENIHEVNFYHTSLSALWFPFGMRSTGVDIYVKGGAYSQWLNNESETLGETDEYDSTKGFEMGAGLQLTLDRTFVMRIEALTLLPLGGEDGPDEALRSPSLNLKISLGIHFDNPLWLLMSAFIMA